MKKYEELTREEKLACVSLYPEESKKDTDENIRIEVWRALGFTEKAKRDSFWMIRIGAWRALGYTEEAKRDTDEDIRREAEIYFSVLDQEL